MRGMILGAGRGTRLRPLTDSLPKILVPVLAVPMLDRLRAWLSRCGVTELALNTHHLAGAVEAHLASVAFPVSLTPDTPEGRPLLPLHIFHEPELLGTGGALVNAAEFWGSGDLLVWNGDIVSALDPNHMLEAHEEESALATLAVQERESGSYLIVDSTGAVCGIDSARRDIRREERPPVGEARLLAFNGISLLAPRFRSLLPALFPAGGPFDLIDALLDAIAAGENVRAWNAGIAFYGTTGSLEQLRALEEGLAARPELLAEWTPD